MNKTELTDEESRKLIDLGIPAGEGTFFPHPEGEYWQGDECGDIIFTLSDLLSILPKRITDRRKIYSLTIEIADCLDENDKWCISYRNTLDMDELDSFQSAEELCDAIYAEICFLKNEYNKNIVWL